MWGERNHSSKCFGLPSFYQIKPPTTLPCKNVLTPHLFQNVLMKVSQILVVLTGAQYGAAVKMFPMYLLSGSTMRLIKQMWFIIFALMVRLFVQWSVELLGINLVKWCKRGLEVTFMSGDTFNWGQTFLTRACQHWNLRHICSDGKNVHGIRHRVGQRIASNCR